MAAAARGPGRGVWFSSWNQVLEGDARDSVSEAGIAALASLVAHGAAPPPGSARALALRFPRLHGRRLQRTYECSRVIVASAAAGGAPVTSCSHVSWGDVAHAFVEAHAEPVRETDFSPAAFAALAHARDVMLAALGADTAMGAAGAATARATCETFVGADETAVGRALWDMLCVLGSVLWSQRSIALVAEIVSILVFVYAAPSAGVNVVRTLTALTSDSPNLVVPVLTRVSPSVGTRNFATGVLDGVLRRLHLPPLSIDDVEEDITVTIANGVRSQLRLARALHVLAPALAGDRRTLIAVREVLAHLMTSYIDAVGAAPVRCGEWIDTNDSARVWVAAVGWMGDDELLPLFAVLGLLLREREAVACATAGGGGEGGGGGGGSCSGGGGSGGRGVAHAYALAAAVGVHDASADDDSQPNDAGPYDFGQWVCGKCTMLNSDLMPHCERCSARRGLAPAKAVAHEVIDVDDAPLAAPLCTAAAFAHVGAAQTDMSLPFASRADLFAAVEARVRAYGAFGVGASANAAGVSPPPLARAVPAEPPAASPRSAGDSMIQRTLPFTSGTKRDSGGNAVSAPRDS